MLINWHRSRNWSTEKHRGRRKKVVSSFCMQEEWRKQKRRWWVVSLWTEKLRSNWAAAKKWPEASSVQFRSAAEFQPFIATRNRKKRGGGKPSKNACWEIFGSMSAGNQTRSRFDGQRSRRAFWHLAECWAGNFLFPLSFFKEEETRPDFSSTGSLFGFYHCGRIFFYITDCHILGRHNCLLHFFQFNKYAFIHSKTKNMQTIVMTKMNKWINK